ncbi:MAG: hypothetical protein HY075_07305 [Deltaproteobacteria bacterium]|nr:hypothetical protein [Deltaproteobacteria bacterium]
MASANQKLLLSSGPSYNDKKTYFHRLQSSDSRRQALEALGKGIAQVSDKNALIELRGFFYAAGDDSAKFEQWLPNMARGYGDSVSQRLLLNYTDQLSDAEATAAFAAMRSDQTFSDIIVELGKRAEALADSDPRLARLAQLLELAIAQTGGHADWVSGRGKGALDTAASKLALAASATAQSRMTYFHKVRAPDQRRVVLEALIKRVTDLGDRAALIVYLDFFAFAAADSAPPYEVWLPQIAYRGVDTIAGKLFSGFDFQLDSAKQVFHGISGDQTRRDVLNVVRKQVAVVKTKEGMSDLASFFAFALSDSATRPSWVREGAAGGLDDTALAALTQFELTEDEASRYFSEVQSDQTAATVLRTLGRKMERNRDSYPVLLQTRMLFEIATRTLGRRSDWVVSSAWGALENASARLIKKPNVDGDEMIRLFKTLRNDQTRADVVNYWRGKITHGYNDKPSLLQLARFFDAATQITKEQVNGDWVVDATAFGASEITAKILRLFPVFEGSFAIEATCEEGGTGCGAGFLDTMIVMNSLTNDALQVSFLHSGTGTAAFAFSSVAATRGATSLDAMADSGTLSKMHVDYDPETGTVDGWIDNSDRLGKIRIHGAQMRSPVEVYDGQAERIAFSVEVGDKLVFPKTVPELDVRGTYDKYPVRLRVRSLSANGETVIGAILTFTTVKNIQIAFQRGTYDPATGVLVLTGQRPNGARVKLVLGMRDETGSTLEGISFGAQAKEFHEIHVSQ